MDIVGWSDRSYDVKSDESASGSTRADIRKAHCCKDSAPTIGSTNFCTVDSQSTWVQLVVSQCNTYDGLNSDDQYCPDFLLGFVQGWNSSGN